MIFYIVITIFILFVVYHIYRRNIYVNEEDCVINKNIKSKHEIVKKKIKNVKKQKKSNSKLVFMDISVADYPMGKIVIKLFDDVVPMTCNNFRVLCSNKNKLTYKGSIFHRVINNFMIQGGDITEGNGRGGMSIYGRKFEDENFDIPHDRPYLLSMANSGKNTNGSQFFITTSETPHLDGKHVVFGEVVDGFKVIDKINNLDTDGNDRPFDDVVISNCGIYKSK